MDKEIWTSGETKVVILLIVWGNSYWILNYTWNTALYVSSYVSQKLSYEIEDILTNIQIRKMNPSKLKGIAKIQSPYTASQGS